MSFTTMLFNTCEDLLDSTDFNSMTTKPHCSSVKSVDSIQFRCQAHETCQCAARDCRRQSVRFAKFQTVSLLLVLAWPAMVGDNRVLNFTFAHFSVDDFSVIWKQGVKLDSIQHHPHVCMHCH